MTFCIPNSQHAERPLTVTFAAQSTYRLGGDVREISCNTWGVDHIVESELINKWAELEEQRQRLNGRC